MYQLNDQLVNRASRFSDRTLAQIGKNREYLRQWAEKYIPEEFATKQDIAKEIRHPEYEIPSDRLFVDLIALIQTWVYAGHGKALPEPSHTSQIDGFLGNDTLRMMEMASADVSKTEYLCFDGKKIHVPGCTIILPEHQDGLSFDTVGKGYRPWRKVGPTHLATIHWDVCRSAQQCFNTLSRNGLASTFGVDNPQRNGQVLVYQWLDPGKYYGFHAGTPANASTFLSFDLSNAVHLRHAAYYERECHTSRPRIVAFAHGKRREILGMYLGQLLATLRILRAVAKHYDYPFTLPAKDGKPITTEIPNLFTVEGKYGAYSHLHVPKSRGKWDVTGLEDQIIYAMLCDNKIREEFPEIAELYRLDKPEWTGWKAERDETWTWREVQNGGS